MHHVLRASASTITLWLNGRPVQVLLDSGSTITLACPSVLLHPVEQKGSLMVTYVHRNVRDVPTAEVQAGSRRGEWPLTIGLILNLLVSLLIGKA